MRLAARSRAGIGDVCSDASPSQSQSRQRTAAGPSASSTAADDGYHCPCWRAWPSASPPAAAASTSRRRRSLARVLRRRSGRAGRGTGRIRSGNPWHAAATVTVTKGSRPSRTGRRGVVAGTSRHGATRVSWSSTLLLPLRRSCCCPLLPPSSPKRRGRRGGQLQINRRMAARKGGLPPRRRTYAVFTCLVLVLHLGRLATRAGRKWLGADLTTADRAANGSAAPWSRGGDGFCGDGHSCARAARPTA